MNFTHDTPLLIAAAFKHDDDNNGDFIVAQMTPEFIVEAAGKVPGAAYVAFREDEGFIVMDCPLRADEEIYVVFNQGPSAARSWSCQAPAMPWAMTSTRRSITGTRLPSTSPAC